MTTRLVGARTVGLDRPAARSLAWLAAVTAMAASILGFVPGLYRDPAVVVAQTHGYDVGNLAVAAALVIALLAMARAGRPAASPAARIVAAAALGTLGYSYVTYAFYVVLNPATALYIAVLGFSGWAFALGFGRMDPADTGERASAVALPRRVGAVFFAAVAVIFGVTWLRQLVTAGLSGQLPAELEAAGWPMNPVFVLDLAFVVPLLLVAAGGLARGSQRAALLAARLAGFVGFLGASLVCMSLGAAAGGQTVDPVIVVLFGAISLGGAGLLTATLARAGQLAESGGVPGRQLR